MGADRVDDDSSEGNGASSPRAGGGAFFVGPTEEEHRESDGVTKVETPSPGKGRSNALLQPTVSALRPPGVPASSDPRARAELSRRRSRIARPTAETNGGEAA